MAWRLVFPNRTWTDADFTPDKYARNFPRFFEDVADLIKGSDSYEGLERIAALERLTAQLEQRIAALENGSVEPPVPGGFSFDFSEPANSGYLLLLQL